MIKQCAVLLALFCAAAAAAHGTDVYLSLSDHSQRNDLGVAGFAPATPTVEESRQSRQLQEVLQDDLLFSRFFNIVEEGPLFTGREEEIAEWRNLGAAMIVGGTLALAGEEMRVTARLLDAGSGKPVWEKQYIGDVHSFRRIAHDINDDIVERFTGERGIAHTRIVFVNNQTRKKELYAVDYDGFNLRKLTTDNSINILPKWSPDGTEIIYTTFLHGNPDVFLYSVNGARRRPVSQRQGLNSAAVFSPDGSRIALTMSRGDVPHLYLIDRAGAILKRLTSGSSNNTSPSFAPNGQEIVFVSDRAGNPQLYIMGLDGGNQRRITTEGFCDSPAWSPRGDKIAFTMRRSGRGSTFDIYVYDLGTGQITRLTQDERHNENPSWSPDGRFLVFSTTRSGKKELYMIAADGSSQRKLTDMVGSSETPSWGP